jgi:hypothetical protein
VGLRSSPTHTAAASLETLQRGDRVAIGGTVYVVAGFDPIGVESPRLYLDHARTGERRTISVDEARGQLDPDRP